MGSYTDIYKSAANSAMLMPGKKPLAPKVDPYRQIADSMAATAQTQQAIDNTPPPPAAPQTTSTPVPTGGSNFANNVTAAPGGQVQAGDPLMEAIRGGQLAPSTAKPQDQGLIDPSAFNGMNLGPMTGTKTQGWTADVNPGAWDGMNLGPLQDTTLPGETPDTWEQRLKDALAKSGDFSPTEELMNEQRDAALRQLAESGASRGMGNSGFEDAMAGDIYRGTARDMGKAYQDFQQQEIQNQMQGAQMLMQDDWKKMDQDQQKAMANLMFELDRKQKFGDDYNPNMGDYEVQMLRDLMMNPDLSESGRIFMGQQLYSMYGPEGFFQKFWESENADTLLPLFNNPEGEAFLKKQYGELPGGSVQGWIDENRRAENSR